ncbi:MAG: copper resistance protein CopC, partial [Roseiflexaceae bacterium]
MSRSLRAVLAALALTFVLVGTVSAHASLVRSTPVAGALLDAAPKELVLEFSEELDAGFSHVQLYNSKNQVINPGPGVVDRSAPTIMRLALGELPKDSYTALWRSRSAADGHVTEGSVPFGVGVAATATSLIPALGTPDPATEAPPPLDAALRWLNLLLVALVFGGLPFALLVWRPALHAATTDDRPFDLDQGGRPMTGDPAIGRRSSVVNGQWSVADDAITRALRRLIVLGGVLFLLTNALFLLTQAATAAGVPLAQSLGAPALELLGSRTGQLILARGGLALLLLVLAWRLPPAGRGTAWPWWIALALAGASALTFSLNAHGAAEAQRAALAITLDWLHIAAMIAWLGGLLPLLLAILAARRAPEHALPLATLIPRFSRLAATCVVLLTLT